MNIKKIVSMTLALSILGTSIFLIPHTAKAQSVSTREISSRTVVSPRTLGLVTVTSQYGASIMTGPGTNYYKITTVPMWTELKYMDSTKRDSSGLDWYKVELSNGSTGWVCSAVSYLA